MKKISIFLIFILFSALCIFRYSKTHDYYILDVISPNKIVIDFNKDLRAEDDEIVELNFETFSTKSYQDRDKIVEKLGISVDDFISLGYLAEIYSKDLIKGEKVKILFDIDKKDYQKNLIERGFAFEKENIIPNKQFLKNLKIAQKLNLVRLNNRSLKYHKLDCKYGLVARDSVLIPKSQLPKEALPCGFCIGSAKSATQNKIKSYEEKIIDIKAPNLVYNSSAIKLLLSDFTKNLKPDITCKNVLCREVVGQINSSQNTLDMALYGYMKIPAINRALDGAIQRGVNVRFVYDVNSSGQNLYPDTFYLVNLLKNSQGDINSQASNLKYSNALMHNKFMIIDGKTVITGSANLTPSDLSGFNSNNLLIIHSDEIAKIYETEFEQMFLKKFHNQKNKNEISQNSEIQIYFSPQDKIITNKIIPLIKKSQKYIYIPSFLITHKAFADSLIEAKNRGVVVKIMLDAVNANSKSTQLSYLRKNGIEVKVENFAGKLHQKTIVIDDLYTISGSMNFSKSGENINDENVVIIRNNGIALFYKDFFQYLWVKIPDKWLKRIPRAESFDSIGSCYDGVDNNFDGKIDKFDSGCLIKH